MSKHQALIDALAGVNGQLGQPSLHSGHVIYAETEEWCSVDINVKLSANKHISGPLARFIKEAANPATICSLLADLEAANKSKAHAIDKAGGLLAALLNVKQSCEFGTITGWDPEQCRNAAKSIDAALAQMAGGG